MWFIVGITLFLIFSPGDAWIKINIEWFTKYNFKDLRSSFGISQLYYNIKTFFAKKINYVCSKQRFTLSANKNKYNIIIYNIVNSD